MASVGGGGPRKRQRVGSSTRLSSSSASYSGDGTLTESLRSIPGGFNDYNTADILLRLQIESSAIAEDIDLHLHSHALRRSNYFAALLSDRWHHLEQDQDSEPEHSPGNRLLRRLNLKIPASTEEPHLTVLRLLYSADFSDVILDASVALSLLPVALQLLFDDCIRACIQFLEAVPWSEEEENAVLGLIPLLGLDESRELLARVSPRSRSSSEEMLQRLITASIGSHPYVASAKVKGFASKMLRDYPSRDCVRRVFDRAFEASLKTVKESLENYSSPDLRGDHDETEAIQRLNLHTAVYHGKDLFWLLERMIELGVADKAVKEWSDQTAFVADLQRAFQEDVWRNIAPGLPALVLRSTARLADAVASGSVLAPREVRLKLVSVWLPVLIVCREKNVSPIPSGQKVLYQELEEIFLRIISTLPMSDAEVLLHQCLSFATRNVDDCPHLVSAYNTWFRRATRPPDS